MIAEKDKANGKDFNKYAHDEMVKAQHHFDMLRKMERADRAEAAYVARKNKRSEQEKKTTNVAPYPSKSID